MQNIVKGEKSWKYINLDELATLKNLQLVSLPRLPDKDTVYYSDNRPDSHYLRVNKVLLTKEPYL